MKKILIVCTGNTCRSPMAGAIANQLAQDRKLEMETKTAGIFAFPGSPATGHAVAVMEEMGLDITEHAATPVTEELIEWADLIITMTEEHKEQLLAAFPRAKEKQITPFSIPDPIGGTVDDYRKTARALQEALAEVLPDVAIGN